HGGDQMGELPARVGQANQVVAHREAWITRPPQPRQLAGNQAIVAYGRRKRDIQSGVFEEQPYENVDQDEGDGDNRGAEGRIFVTIRNHASMAGAIVKKYPSRDQSANLRFSHEGNVLKEERVMAVQLYL